VGPAGATSARVGAQILISASRVVPRCIGFEALLLVTLDVAEKLRQARGG